MMQRVMRMKRELQMLEDSPPPGICCCPKGDSVEELDAQIVGAKGTPYEGGLFKLDVQVPERYPFEPPKIRFRTPIYHPNIDDAGRICLDSLKMPPKGAWKPALNLSTLLTSIQQLMCEPNPDDPLMTEISDEFRSCRSSFERNARQWTAKYAMEGTQTAQCHREESDSSESSDSEAEVKGSQAIGCRPLIESDASSKRHSSDTDSESKSKRRRMVT